jgi:hypothetical protein
MSNEDIDEANRHVNDPADCLPEDRRVSDQGSAHQTGDYHRRRVKIGIACLAMTCATALCLCQLTYAASAATTPDSTVSPQANGTYRVIVRAPRSSGATDALTPAISEDELLTECTLWSNEPNTNECLNPTSPELVGYGKVPTSAVGRGKEQTPVGTYRFLKYYELDQEDLPLGSQVLEATQTEYLNSATKKKAPIPVGLYGITAPWTMKTSWDDASGTTPWRTPGGEFDDAGAVVDPSVGAAKGTLSWNVKQLVQEWANRESIAPGRTDDGFIMADAESPTTVEDVLSFDNKPGKEGYLEYLAEPDVTPPTKPEGPLRFV